MKLLYGDVLWNLVWMIPLFLILPALAASGRKKISAMLFPGAGEARIKSYSSLDKHRRAIRTVSLILSVLCALIAAAGPAWGRKILPDAGPGHDLLVLFDVSRSMLADDVKPSRLAQGKWLVRELVKLNPEDRFGLIAFAGTAFLQCPLTIDKTSFLQLTDALDTDTIALGGTNIQAALETAVKAFEGAEGNHKAVILITDGDELTGRAASVVQQLSQAGIPLFIAGIGDPGNPSIIRVTAEDGSKKILTDEEGNTVKSPLNEAQLAELARDTSGIYVRSTVAEPGLDEIENGIRHLDRKRGKNLLSGAKPIERAAYPLAASLFFLFLFLALPETRRKTNPASRMPLIVFCLLFPLSARAQEQKDVPQEPPAVQSPAPADKAAQTARDHFNAGLQAHRKKELETARTEYEKSITMENDPNVRAAAYQNMGAIHHQEARDCMTKANELLKNQKLDESEKNIDLALASMDQAEADYKENLLFSAKAGTEGAVRNQQMLLHERKDAQELKKEIEKLKKMQEEARKQTQKAHDQQKQQNQQQDQQNQDQQKQDQQKQDQQKQNQQKQDQQKQDQQNQDQQNQQQKQDQQKQDQQEQNRQETAKAEQQTRDLRDQARKLEQSELEKKAEEARRELEQAQKSQSEGENQKAEEHLKKALEALGGKQDRKDDGKDRKDQSGKDSGKDQKKEEQPSGGEKDKQEPQKKQAGTAAKPSEHPEDIDPKQAEAILDAMARDEKELRDMLKEQQKRNAPAQKPRKDW